MLIEVLLLVAGPAKEFNQSSVMALHCRPFNVSVPKYFVLKKNMSLIKNVPMCFSERKWLIASAVQKKGQFVPKKYWSLTLAMQRRTL